MSLQLLSTLLINRVLLLLCVTIDVTQVKPRAMHVSTEKAIALREKPPFDIIKVIVVPIAECQKEVL